eukprot:11151485-Prorocentrum_lima.AAC.1
MEHVGLAVSKQLRTNVVAASIVVVQHTAVVQHVVVLAAVVETCASWKVVEIPMLQDELDAT